MGEHVRERRENRSLTIMYIRFVYDAPVESMQARAGIFRASDILLENEFTPDTVRQEVQSIRHWFNDFLDRPQSFSKSKSKSKWKDTKGLSWFKPTAKEHIEKTYALKRILEANGVPMTVLRSKRLGYVVYEDEFQIVAEPFSDTNC